MADQAASWFTGSSNQRKVKMSASGTQRPAPRLRISLPGTSSSINKSSSLSCGGSFSQSEREDKDNSDLEQKKEHWQRKATKSVEENSPQPSPAPNITPPQSKFDYPPSNCSFKAQKTLNKATDTSGLFSHNREYEDESPEGEIYVNPKMIKPAKIKPANQHKKRTVNLEEIKEVMKSQVYPDEFDIEDEHYFEERFKREIRRFVPEEEVNEVPDWMSLDNEEFLCETEDAADVEQYWEDVVRTID